MLLNWSLIVGITSPSPCVARPAGSVGDGSINLTRGFDYEMVSK